MQPSRLTPPPSIGVYVHIPWCQKRCQYCDFNAYKLNDDRAFVPYQQAILANIHAQRAQLTRPIQTIFIGGGTPSLYPPVYLADILNAIRDTGNLAPNAEITMEANPESATAERLAIWRAAGINRLSFGAQSFNDGHLAALGRIHDSSTTQSAIKAAKAAGFSRINIDIMYGLPAQTVAKSAQDMEIALALDLEHISYYQLTLEPDSPFSRKPPTLPGEDTIADMEATTAELLAQAGFTRYEVSAWTKSGGECAHNFNYWKFGDYVGIGCGAHGKITDEGTIWRSVHKAIPTSYQKAPTAHWSEVPLSERTDEFMLNALRLTGGFSLALFEARTGQSAESLTPAIARAVAKGLLHIKDDCIRPTTLGMRFLNDLQQVFMTDA